MCLTVDSNRKPPKTVKTVYKVVSVDAAGIRTPHENAPFKPGVFKAKRPRKTVPESGNIGGGVIHVYETLKRAKRARGGYASRVILECKAYPKHFVAYGTNGDVAYTQITVPKTQFAPLPAKVVKDARRAVKNRREQLAGNLTELKDLFVAANDSNTWRIRNLISHVTRLTDDIANLEKALLQ